MLFELAVFPLASAKNSEMTSSGSSDELLSKAETEGTVRVIVGLQALGPPGPASRRQTSMQLAGAIDQAQDRLLDTLDDPEASASARKFDTIPFVALKADAATIRELRADPQVISLQEDVKVYPSLADSIPLVRADAAWNEGYTGQGQAVAILDTGVDYAHPFLAAKLISEACYSNFYGDGVSLCPGLPTETSTGAGLNCDMSISSCSHGTHVAGIAMGNGVNSGVAKGSGLISIQVFTKYYGAYNCDPNPSPCLIAWTSDIFLGLQRVLTLHEAGMPIAAVNMSLGGGNYSDYCDASQSAVKAVIDLLRAHGIATVVAAGNHDPARSAEFWGTISFPACVSAAIGVGASDDADVIQDFSNMSAMVDLLAPGLGIISSVPGNGWEAKSGTSMATPHVAGVFAVLKSKNPDATVDELEQLLKSTGPLLSKTQNAVTITKPRIDVAAALDQIPDLLYVDVSTDHPGLFVRDADLITLTATFSGGSAIDEASPPAISIGDAVSGALMTRQSNLVWTYIWNVPPGHDHEELVSIEAVDTRGSPVTTTTGQTSFIIDNVSPVAPSSVVITPQSGTVVANTLNSTNTYLTASAAIGAGQAAGGRAELLVVDSVMASDANILAGDTSVAFSTSDGTPLASELQSLIPAGGAVSVRLYDAAGNSSDSVAGNPALTVDYGLPVISVHSTVTVEAASAAGAIAAYTAPNASDTVDGTTTTACLPVSGSLFALGSTIVTCSKTDAAGNPAVPATFTVHVHDTTAPVIAAHGTTVAEAFSVAGAVVTYTPPASTDAVDGTIAAACLPASGSLFPLGNTTVTCSRTDPSGNSSLPRNFIVEVELNPLVHPSGTLVKLANDPTVWYLDGGQGHGFATETEFLSQGFAWNLIVIITPEEMDLYPVGSNIRIHSGTLIKESDHPLVYLVDGDTVHPFPSADIFLNLGYSWAAIRTTIAGETDWYTAGSLMAPSVTHYTSTKVKILDSAAVFLLQQAGDVMQRRWVASEGVYLSQGWQWPEIITISPNEMNGYAPGVNLFYQDGTLIQGAGDPTVYVMESQLKRPFPSAERFVQMGYQWSNIILIPADECQAIAPGTTV